ncbi:P-loop NTPase fold protein [Actinoplanes sp. NPDC049265]|uniref:P-loop NTPase fold protein n=1 Tax=Actinoplanes sp. NPDC049265 TaxID=3363902 RepID=UPI0037171C79
MLDEIGAHASSTVVALVGPWGSGKTSTVNLILDSLRAERWGVARLNPWALGSAEAIVAELLAAIGEALPGKAVRARERLATYAEVAAPWLALIPMAGEAASSAGEMLARRLRGDGTVQTRFEQLSSELSKLTRSVLIFVDDVDRLQPDELLALFRAVRVLGRLPHVHYFIAYDQRTLLDLLTATPLAGGRETRALAFLEKIVTLRVDQPLIRAEQSALLFNRRLTELLADLGASLGDEERRRVSDEWELLLAADLAEPRSINRFLAQLRVYLPLVGRDEVDLADFVVITHLRSAHPELYNALLADRAVLAAPAGEGDETRAAAWRERRRVAGSDRLYAAVGRMFPALRADGPGEPRRRGIGHPDYVDRYFTFMPADADVTDAELLVALREWAGGGMPGRHLVAALTPDRDDRHECERSAGVIRRLDAVHDQLTSAEAATLVGGVVPYLPLPAGPGLILGGPDAAVARWLSHLILMAEAIDPEQVTAVAAGRGIAALVGLLRAAPRGSAMAEAAADAGWRLFREHVAAGDAAPDAPAESLFALIDDLAGAARTNRRLRRAVDDGLSVPDLGARLVEIGVEPGSGRPVILDFGPEALINRLGRVRVRAGGDVGGPLDRTDTSWASRRRHVLAALRAGREPMTVPALPAEAAPMLRDHSVLALDTPSSPELAVGVTVLTPALAEEPRVGGAPAGPPGDDVVLRAMENSAIAEWLRSRAGGDRPGWRITEADGRTRTRVAADLGPAGSGRPPIRAGAQIRSGLDHLVPFVVADFQVGLWAALSLDELVTLIEAMLRGAREAAVAIYQELPARSPDAGLAMRLEVTAERGLDAVVDLAGLERADPAERTVRRLAHGMAGPARTPEGAGADAELAVAFTAELLRRSGYRGYESRLR